MDISSLLAASPVMPVIVLDRAADAVPLARALVAGGIRVLEVTLRTAAALDSIRAISAEVPDAIVGIGTVLTPQDLERAQALGARYALSPGATPPQPFFSIRNNDPAVDGFLISNGVDFVNRVPTNFASAGMNFVCSYPQSMLNSLDIVGALGSYNTSGLSLLEWDFGVGESVGIDVGYSNMTIALVPEPASLGLLALALPLAARRRSARGNA